MMGFAAAARILDAAIDAGVSPGAVAEVGSRSGCLWRHATGRLTYDADSPPATAETIFDLASLTKVIATTTLAMRHVDEGLTPLGLPVAEALRTWRGSDREMVTVRDLLEHASGLTAHLAFYRDHVGRADFEPAIGRLPLEYAPRAGSIYSDLGFILLGFILTDRHPSGMGLSAQFDEVAARRGWGDMRFHPPPEWRLPHGADGAGSLARADAHRRGSRRERLGPGGRGRTRGTLRQRRRGRPVRPRHPDGLRRRRAACVGGDLPRVPHPVDGARQLAGRRLGYDAADLVVRNTAVCGLHRAYRIHGNIALDRPGLRSLCGAADQPGASFPVQPGDPRLAAGVPRRGDGDRLKR